jgi:PhzF family phenazine biosynthesis protein
MTVVKHIAAFTDQGTGGNPAGVVIGEFLPTAERMQKIAAEVGFSETVFSAPQEDGWITRYYSPETEVPFCGHATIALGAALAQAHGSGRYRLHLSEGEIEVEAGKEDGRARAKLTSLPTNSSPFPSPLVDEALALFGYSRDDLDTDLLPRRMNAGAEHLFVALNSRERLSAMAYDLEAGRAFMRRHGFVTIALVWREADALFHARNAFASGGVLEDPATGAAAAALGGMLRDGGVITEGEFTILQGRDMGRPSRLFVSVGNQIGSPVHVSGEASPM